jgi:hypothetical protein
MPLAGIGVETMRNRGKIGRKKKNAVLKIV